MRCNSKRRTKNMAFSRRNFLATMIAAGTWGRWSLLDALAAGSDYRALVSIFLFGGNDANNLIVPLSTERYRNYADSRGGLALSQSSLLPIATAAGDSYGLHPRLGDLQQLFLRNKLAI